KPARDTRLSIPRLGTITVDFPSGENTAIVLALETPEAHDGPRPDLAVSAQDVVREGEAVTVTVHNLGPAAAEGVRVVLLDAAGAVVAESVVPHLDTPRDSLRAQRQV